MLGVDEFRSVEQANKSYKDAERRLKKINICLIPAGIVSLILFIPFVTEVQLPNALSMVLVVASLGLQIYSEAIFYFVKFFLLPFRKLGKFIGFIVWLVIWATISIAMVVFWPICLIFYARYLCGITLECAKDIVLIETTN